MNLNIISSRTARILKTVIPEFKAQNLPTLQQNETAQANKRNDTSSNHDNENVLPVSQTHSPLQVSVRKV